MQLSFIGAGKMATAVACGLIRQKMFSPSQLRGSDISVAACAAFTELTGSECLNDNAAAVVGADTVILAVKPQDAGKALEALAGTFGGKLLISIAAGLTLAKLQTWTGSDRIIRVMPNTPAMVNLGASVYSCAPGVTQADRELAAKIFNAIGISFEMPEEKLDAVTALSGSGPAFLFAYIEGMIDGAELLGLEPEPALELAVQTIAGAAEMLKRRLGTPAELRQAVTSKGGTTAAGLASFEADDFHGAIVRCLEAAARRSRELGRDG